MCGLVEISDMGKLTKLKPFTHHNN